MLHLKKYFTEGLIQVAILLSLCGVRVDVGPYLPPLHEIILGPSYGLTQTRFHNLHSSLEGHYLHPKSVDLDNFFTSRRLLGLVRSLDRLRVPAAELEAWLVHRDPDTLASVPGEPAGLEGGGDLEGGDNPSDFSPRTAGGGGGPEMYSEIRENVLEAIPRSEEEQGIENLTKEGMDLLDLLWQDRTDGPHQTLGYRGLQRTDEAFLSPLDEEEEESEEDENHWRESYRNERHSYPQVDRELVQDISNQLTSLEAQTALSLQDCLQLLEDTFPFEQQQKLSDPVEENWRESPDDSFQESLLSPLHSYEDPTLDLEQQWQDLLAIMEPMDMDVDHTASDSFLGNEADNTESRSLESMEFLDQSLVQQDVSLHQAVLPRPGPAICPFGLPTDGNLTVEPILQLSQINQSSSNFHNSSFTFGSADLTDTFPSPLNDTGFAMDPIPPGILLEKSGLHSPLGPLLEDAMLDEINLLDLALEEGFSTAQVSQLEAELDSDSGLSLGFSPASPSNSETSCSSCCSSSSSSSSSISSTSTSFSEEDSIEYGNYIDAEEEGAVGGYHSEVSKMCSTSYQESSNFHHLPWLENVAHNHTYNLPLAFLNVGKTQRQHSGKTQSPDPEKTQRPHFEKPRKRTLSDKHWSRDERRARIMKIPFSNDRIVNLPVEEFNELLAKHHLSEAQLTLVRDIRRRGKNKMAAQNCRKRKLDTLQGLEEGVKVLQHRRARLLKEKAQTLRSVREMKQHLSELYQDIFSRLRDEQGQAFSETDYALRLGNDGHVVLASRHNSTNEHSRMPNKKQKNKKK